MSRVSTERFDYLRQIYTEGAPVGMPDYERLALIREFVTLFDDDTDRHVHSVVCSNCGRGGYQGALYGRRCWGCTRDFADCACPVKAGFQPSTAESDRQQRDGRPMMEAPVSLEGRDTNSGAAER